MNRRAALRLLAGGACLVPGAGCFRQLLDRPADYQLAEKFFGKPKQPKAPKVAPASVEVARQVDELGRRIIDQNTFTGLDPVFHTVGVPEAVLFHRGTAELFISEGLVKKCKTEPVLAAALCSELGAMMAEKRAGISVGLDKEPIPNVALPGNEFDPAGARAAELAVMQKKIDDRRAARRADAAELAKQLLGGAGFDPAEFDRAEPMLRQSDRGEVLRKQMAGSAPAPTWKH